MNTSNSIRGHKVRRKHASSSQSSSKSGSLRASPHAAILEAGVDSRTTSHPRRSWPWTIAWLVLAMLAVGLLLVSAVQRLYTPTTEAECSDADVEKRPTVGCNSFLVSHSFAVLCIHIITGIVAVGSAFYQFHPTARARWPAIHRITGRAYVISVLISSICAVELSLFNAAGLQGAFGFSLMAVCWFGTTAMAWRRVRQGMYQTHRVWMNRSFSITLAFVTLRVWLLPLIPIVAAATNHTASESFGIAYGVVPWMCWVPNLIAAECYNHYAGYIKKSCQEGE